MKKILVLILFTYGVVQGQTGEIQTSLGKIKFELYPDKAPKTVENFVRYILAKKYDAGTFFRVCTPENEANRAVKIQVIQAGIAPDETAFEPIALETTEQTGLTHKHGTLSMARSSPASAQGSFFICIEDQPELDFKGKRQPDGQGFAAFGKVTEGMDIVLKIQQAEEKNQRLLSPIIIDRIRLD